MRGTLREIVRLLTVVTAAALAAAGAAIYLDERPREEPSRADTAAAGQVRAHYDSHPPRPDWQVREVEARAGRVVVRLEIPAGQAAALLKSPMGFQQDAIARACPGARLWRDVERMTEVQIRAQMPGGEVFLRVDCRAYADLG